MLKFVNKNSLSVLLSILALLNIEVFSTISALAVTTSASSSPSTTSAKIVIPTDTGLSENTFAQVLDRVLNWLLMIFVILATMAFVVTGLQFIFSFGGASGSEAQAKKNFTYTIIAIFIVGGALIILNTIVGLLGNGSTNSTQSNTAWIDPDIGQSFSPNSTTQQPVYTPGNGTAPYATPTTQQPISPAIPPTWSQ